MWRQQKVAIQHFVLLQSDKSNAIIDHITYLFTQRYILKTAALFPKMIAKWNSDLFVRSSIMTTTPIINTKAYRITPSF
jgi:hypothetical protein